MSELKRYQEAIDSYDKAIQLNPNYSNVYYNKGNSLRDLKRYQEAIDCYDKAIELNPNDLDAYNNKNILIESGFQFDLFD